jgi:putative NIF3 family GTP cyclohydrolase 1 type 2
MRGLSLVSTVTSIAAVVFLCGSVFAQQQPETPRSGVPPTAAEVIQRIETSLGVGVSPGTVDTIKEGDPNTPVTGIATTFIPTMAVLRQAAAQGRNLVITHEPTFYNHLDERTLFEHDAVYEEKLAFIRDHHLVLFRFHDGWHRRQPDGIVEGWVRAAGWERYRNPGEQFFFTLPPTTLAALSKQLQQTFGGRILRVVGDPQMSVTKVAFAPGASGESVQIKALELDDVEVLVAGEAAEWETVEYAHDATLQGRHKALILLGHDTSEEIGMENCARWLRTLFPNVPVEFIPAGEPYWLPEHPPTSSHKR